MKSRPLKDMLTAAALVVIMAGVQRLAPVLGPMLVAALLSILCYPLMRWLTDRGMPLALSVAGTLFAVCLVAAAVALLVSGPLDDVVRRVPELMDKCSAAVNSMLAFASDLGLAPSRDVGDSWMDREAVDEFVANSLTRVARSLGAGFIIAIMMIFMLAEASRYPAKMQAAFGPHHVATRRMGEVVVAFRRYIAIKSLMSLATGLSLGLVLWWWNIEFAVFWGFLAFLLNYIPSLGSFIAAVPATLMVLGDHGWGWGLAVAGWYFVVNTVFGSLVEPKLQGEGLGLSPLVVFLSLFFWGWLLGPVGVLLSAPLTMVVRIAADATPDLRWVAVLLGPAR